MPALEDYTCPACHQAFQTVNSKNQHLRRSRSCAWYRSGKLTNSLFNNPLDNGVEDVSNIVLDDRDLFELIPPSDFASYPSDLAIG